MWKVEASRRQSQSMASSYDHWAVLAFTLMFPVYIVYQTAIQAGFISNVLFGAFTAISILAFPLLAVSVIRRQQLTASGIEIAFGAFLLLFFLTVMWGASNGISAEVTSPHLAFGVKAIVLFLLGVSTPWESDRFRKFAWFMNAIVAAYVLYHSDGGSLAFSNPAMMQSEIEFDYHGIAFACMVLGIAASGRVRFSARLVTYTLTFSCLYVIGARSEFVALLPVMFAIELSGPSKKLTTLIVAAAIALGIAVLYTSLELDAIDHRIVSLRLLSEDLSAIERLYVIPPALRTIYDFPLYGGYGTYEAGNYAHNLLSVWVDLGLPGFLLLLFLLITVFLGLHRNKPNNGRAIEYSACVAAIVGTTFLLVFAKAYTYPMLPLALGMFQRYMRRKES